MQTPYLVLRGTLVILALFPAAGCNLWPFSTPGGVPVATGRPGQVLVGEPKIGVPYQVDVYTHCGLRHVEFGGSSWAIHDSLGDGANPPRDFGNPTDHGLITLTSPDEATYLSERGAVRTLTKGDGLAWVQGCG